MSPALWPTIGAQRKCVHRHADFWLLAPDVHMGAAILVQQDLAEAGNRIHFRPYRAREHHGKWKAIRRTDRGAAVAVRCPTTLWVQVMGHFVIGGRGGRDRPPGPITRPAAQTPSCPV